MALVRKQPATPAPEHSRSRARDLPGLIAQLEDPNPTARRWAARDLREHPEASAALVGRLSQEADVSVRAVLLSTLTHLGVRAAVGGLVDALRSQDAAQRNEAIEAMKQLPREVGPIMGTLLSDPNADVRIFAVNILESLRHPEVEGWLLTVIEKDPHLNVCATAVDLLGEVGSPAAREPLRRLKARYRDEPYIQFAADLALKRLETDS